MDLFDLAVRISLNMDDFNNGLNQAKAKLSSVSASLSSFASGLDGIGTKLISVGRTLTTAVTVPIVGLATAAATTAVSFLQLKENTTTAFTTMFGSAEKATKMVQDLYDFAQRMPYSYQSYLEASKALVSMGISAENVIPYLTDLSDAAAATGSGAEGVTTLSEAIGRMSSKGKVQLKELQIFTNMGVQAVNILGNEYGVTTEKIYDMMEKGELLTSQALPKLLDGMKNGTKGVNGMTAAYGGLAESMEGTLSGAIDTLSARWRDFSTKLFDSANAYPVLTKMINNVAAAIQKLPKVFESFSKKVTPFLEKVNEKIEEFSAWIDKASDDDLAKLVAGLGMLVALGPALWILGGAFKAVAGAISAVSITMNAISWIIPQVTAVLTAISTVGLGPLIAIAMAAVGVFVFLREEWGNVIATFNGFIEKTGIIQVFQSIKDKAIELWNKLGNLRDLFYVIGAAVLTVLSPAIAVVMGVFNGLAKAIDGVMTWLNGLVDALSGLGQILLGVFTGNKEKILAGVDSLWKGIKGMFQGGIETITGWFVGYYQGIYEFFENALEKFGIKDAFGKINNAVSEWLSNLKTSISTWFDTLNQNIGSKLDETKSKFNEWKDKTSNWFTEKKDTLVNGFNAWWTPIESWFAEKTTQISIKFEGIKSEVKKVMDDPNYLITLMDGWTNSLNEWSGSKIELFLTEFDKWQVKISNWFTEKKDTFVNGFQSWWDGVIVWFTGLPMALQIMLGTLTAPIAIFFPQTWEKISAWFDQTKENLPLKFEEWKTSISNWFTEKTNTFANGFQSWWDSAGNWITQTAQDIPKKFDEWKATIAQWFSNLGKDNMENMESGIDQKTQEPNFILKLGRTILKLLGAAVVAVAVGIIGVGWAIVDYIWQGLQNGWNWMINEVPKLLGKLGSKIGEIFNNIASTVSGWIEKIKGFFNFSWSLPKLKMPHFTVSGSFSLNPLSVPSFGIDWYAKGGILKDPTLFGINPFNGNAMVGGEAGPEAITPIDKLQDYVKVAVSGSKDEEVSKLSKTVDGLFELLSQYLPDLANMNVVLSNGALVGGLSSDLDNSLGVTNALKARGTA